MKIKDGLQGGKIAPVVILALLLNPLAHGAPQEPAATRSTDPQAQNAEAPPSPQPSDRNAPVSAPATSPGAAPAASDQLPDSPGTLQAQSGQAAPQQPPQAQEAQQAQPQPQNRPHEPVGTAAAESVPTSGVAASRPAGAALAPAKQRRIRSILIKTGALVGIGVAVGATMALSQGSPSKPPGSH